MKNLTSDSTEAQPLIYKYKFFYFSRYSIIWLQLTLCRRVTVLDRSTFEEWKNGRSQSSEPTAADAEAEAAPDTSRPWFQQKPTREIPVIGTTEEKGASFDEIIQLISTGQPVPGIRQIPDQLSAEPPSASSIPAPPKKPWER